MIEDFFHHSFPGLKNNVYTLSFNKQSKVRKQTNFLWLMNKYVLNYQFVVKYYN